MRLSLLSVCVGTLRQSHLKAAPAGQAGFLGQTSGESRRTMPALLKIERLTCALLALDSSMDFLSGRLDDRRALV
jgi:hypothetical protein